MLIYQMRSTDHVNGALVSLHWLRVPERIKYKIAVLTYKVMQPDAGVCASVPETSHSDRRSARPTNTALCQL